MRRRTGLLEAALAAIVAAAVVLRAPPAQPSPMVCEAPTLDGLDERLTRLEALVHDLHAPSGSTNIHPSESRIQRELREVAREYRKRESASITCIEVQDGE
jgi:hypothetical protein